MPAVREPLEIASDDGRCKLLLADGPGAAAFSATVELEGVRATVAAERLEAESLVEFLRHASVEEEAEPEWQTFNGELSLRISGAGLEVELWRPFDPAWSVRAVIPVSREVLCGLASPAALFFA